MYFTGYLAHENKKGKTSFFLIKWSNPNNFKVDVYQNV